MKKAWNTIKRLHSDDDGAVAIEKILILLAIAIPLILALLLFRKAIIVKLWELYDLIVD